MLLNGMWLKLWCVSQYVLLIHKWYDKLTIYVIHVVKRWRLVTINQASTHINTRDPSFYSAFSNIAESCILSNNSGQLDLENKRYPFPNL